jgi:hypothetical protein
MQPLRVAQAASRAILRPMRQAIQPTPLIERFVAVERPHCPVLTLVLDTQEGRLHVRIRLPAARELARELTATLTHCG